MAELKKIHIPNIGDFDSVEVIEIMVKVGDKINIEDSLITVESDKASMDIPSPASGLIKSLNIKEGDEVKEGSLILSIDSEIEDTSEVKAPAEKKQATQKKEIQPSPQNEGSDEEYDVAVLGSGPGGYTAAFRAADLGLKVVLIERYTTIGGVCLNVGCIPSKALLHVAKVIDDAAAMASHGVTFGTPKIDLDKIRDWKESVVGQLTGGLGGMAKARKVKTVFGYGKFTSDKTIEVEGADGKTTITFDNAIIAAGSSVVDLPFIPTEDPRVIDSTGALELQDIPEEMLVLGGGIIGLEMGTVYKALGSNVSVVTF